MTHRHTFGLAALVALAACSTAQSTDEYALEVDSAAASNASAPHVSGVPSSVIQVAAQSGAFNTLTTALRKSGLADSLEADGPFTLLAPTDAAFAKMNPDSLNALLADSARLMEVLRYHVIAGGMPSGDMATMAEVPSLDGAPVALATANGRLQLNGSANVTSPDIVAGNGVIHAIDTVLEPPR